MKKLIIVPVSIAFPLLFSCENDGCECTKRTFNYDGEYPTSQTEVVDCPSGMEDGESLIEWRDDDKIDHVITRTCI